MKSVYLIEQDVNGLYGEYLTETVVVATSEKAARAAAASLGDAGGGGAFALVVHPKRLTVTLLGPLTGQLHSHQARLSHLKSLILAVGTGEDIP